MKRPPTLALVRCLLLLIAGNSTAQAQPPARPLAPPPKPVARPVPAPRGPGHTATIDMQRILAEYKPFQEQLAELSAANETRWAPVKQLRAETEKSEDRLRTFVPGSPNHATALRAVHDLQGDVAAAEKTAQYECDRVEVVLYGEFYRHIERTIGDHAQRNNIALVINRRAPEPFAAELTAAKSLFEQRIAFENNIDITNAILAHLIESKYRVQIPQTMSE